MPKRPKRERAQGFSDRPVNYEAREKAAAERAAIIAEREAAEEREQQARAAVQQRGHQAGREWADAVPPISDSVWETRAFVDSFLEGALERFKEDADDRRLRTFIGAVMGALQDEVDARDVSVISEVVNAQKRLEREQARKQKILDEIDAEKRRNEVTVRRARMAAAMAAKAAKTQTC